MHSTCSTVFKVPKGGMERVMLGITRKDRKSRPNLN